MNISIQKIEPFLRIPESVRGIVASYQRTFGGEPWNEGYVCPVCGARIRFPKQRACPSCAARGESVLLVEYWPASKVMSDFYREMMKPEALCLVAKNDDKIVGFIWGYRIVVDEHIDDYLESPGLSRLISGEFFYLDDAAVFPNTSFAVSGKGSSRTCFKPSRRRISSPGRSINPGCSVFLRTSTGERSSDHKESGHHGHFLGDRKSGLVAQRRPHPFFHLPIWPYYIYKPINHFNEKDNSFRENTDRSLAHRFGHGQ